MKVEKLTGLGLGMAVFAGWIGFACSQQTGDQVEVGTTQVELRSDLTFSDGPSERPDTSNISTNLGPQDKPVNLPPGNGRWRDPLYDAKSYDELLLASLKNSESQKKIAQKDHVPVQPWTQTEKNWMRGGKGFGVAAVAMAPTGTVHINDAGYYSANETFMPVAPAPESSAPTATLFKSGKPLIFHSRATGFAHDPPIDSSLTEQVPVLETKLELTPIPETRVYLSAQPKSEVTLVPAEKRLDLMKGNKNLNRHRFDQLP